MKKIEKSSIAEIFSIFHDGNIIYEKYDSNTLYLKIGIKYLAKLINNNFDNFFIKLNNIENIHFVPWSSEENEKLSAIKNVLEIFNMNLDILEGNLINDQIQVICEQNSG